MDIMTFTIKQTQDVCVDKLTSTSGKDLEIMANINHPDQLDAVMEGFADAIFGSRFGVERMEMLLRLTCSFQGRARDDLTHIGEKTTQVPSWTPMQNNGP